ncbi:glycosyltransferase family A protein [Nocardioides guangzhouensis]|uniref:glycosyltransferase family A protein n=1 Tax=Nocardioides guangzhouensis TaxID=2497878 RepID=UPI0014384B89|nr:glycosyltransferase family A protein [Nocardioides guangzhouensis]
MDISTDLRREEHSIRLRRAALAEHSTLAWRTRLASRAGVPFRPQPRTSVLLATMRPGKLAFALRQFGRQRGVDAELVLVTHGFTADESRVRDVIGDRPATLVPKPREAMFGDVLNAGVDAAAGDVIVKMDDDDWYGPDFLSDLLWARHYSGADVTGMPAEFVYLEGSDRTIRRTDESERHAKFIAGGTMLLPRGLLRELGGFRKVRRSVDANLLAALQAARSQVYRTQGLGYVLHRSPGGHTWDPGDAYFLDADRLGETWEGFTPSRLMEHEPTETTPDGC